MKNVKKLFAMMLAVLMMLGLLMTTAMADDSYTITINNTQTGHTYEAYQIFSGTLSSDGNILTGIEWGSGIANGETLLAALKTTDGFTSGNTNAFAACSDAAGVAKVIEKWAINGNYIKKFADVVGQHLNQGAAIKSTADEGEYTITVTEPGYYLVKDKSGSLANVSDTATDYLLQVVKSVEIAPKAQMPTFTHKVNGSRVGTFGDASDGEVRAPIYHELEATLPGSYSDYDQYHLRFEVAIPDGLNVVTDTNGEIDISMITAQVVHPSQSSITGITLTAGAVTWDEEGRTLTIDLGDLKDRSLNLNDRVEVMFITSVNPNATLGKGSDDGLGNVVNATMYFSNDVTQPANTAAGDIQYGTLSDEVSVYTYQLEITKVDSIDTNKKLSGAEFKLYRNIGEGRTPYYATVNEDGWVSGWTDVENDATVLTTGDDGKITVKGLDSAVYHLKEVEAPEGYEKLDDDEQVSLNSSITGQTLNALSGVVEGNSVTGNVVNGMVAGMIRNNPGTTLPTTGGVGTTIFYIVGGALVLGAAVAFVVKRRTEA